jgi:hypothetical protein
MSPRSLVVDPAGPATLPAFPASRESSKRRDKDRSPVRGWLSMRHAASAALASLLLVACGGDEAATASKGAAAAGASGAAGSSSTGEGGSSMAGGAGGSVGGAPSTGGASAGGAAGAGVGGAVPSAPATHVVRRVMLGDANPDGTLADDAWKQFGVNVDGLVSAPGTMPHCTPVPGGKADDIQQNGNDGIDNAFGRSIVKLIKSFSTGAPPTEALTTSIAGGGSTLVFSFDGLPLGADGPVSAGQLFAARGRKDAMGKQIVPTDAEWSDGTYGWDLLDSQLSATSPPTSKTQLAAGVLAMNVWSAGGADEITLSLPVKGVPLDLHVRRARIRATFSGDHRTSSGVIGGLLVTEEFVTQFDLIAGRLSTSLCNAALKGVVDTSLRISSDILADGTQDSSKTCDAISIGLGFETAPGALGSAVSPDPLGPDPCPLGRASKEQRRTRRAAWPARTPARTAARARPPA